jgi:hypothetical protein
LVAKHLMKNKKKTVREKVKVFQDVFDIMNDF